MNKKYIILIILIVVIVAMAIIFTVYLKSQKQISQVNQPAPSTETQIKLFSTNIGTSTANYGSNLGIFVDDRTISNYNKFYFPASFVVDKDLDMVAVLDSIRNRIAIFSLSGQYRGEISLPFTMQAIDMAWFPQTNTFIFVFQDKPEIGVLKIDLKNNFSIESNNIFSIPKILGVQKIDNVIMHIWPINIIDDSKNSFVLDINLNKFSSPIMSQTDAGIDLVSNTNQSLSNIISSSTDSFEKSYNGKNLASLQFVGTDSRNNVYVLVNYAGKTIESERSLLVYRISPSGTITGKVEVFSSPKMLTNHYVFVDQDGSIFYMRADDLKTVSFYKFEI